MVRVVLKDLDIDMMIRSGDEFTLVEVMKLSAAASNPDKTLQVVTEAITKGMSAEELEKFESLTMDQFVRFMNVYSEAVENLKLREGEEKDMMA